jgi:hypothetical protein
MTIRIDRLNVEMRGGDARNGRLLAEALAGRLGALANRAAPRTPRTRVVTPEIGEAGSPAITAQRIVDEMARELGRP